MIEFGIDLGTANTVVCDAAGAVVLEEPSVVLIRSQGARRRTLTATGHSAVDLVGRTPATVVPVHPLHDGAVTDLETTRLYLRSLLERADPGRWRTRRTRAVLGVPGGATALERRALLEAADEAGITRAVALDEPIAGAVGCGVDPMERRARMVVDVGGGTAEASAFCFGELLAQRCSRVAGDEMSDAVARHLREQHNVVVGELAAEVVKVRAGQTGESEVLVQGRDAGTGRARQVSVPVDDINAALRPVIVSIVATLSACLDELSPQATSDVLAEGILLLGGGSLAGGFIETLEQSFGLPVKRADQPLTCVARGAAASLRLPDVLDAYGQQL